MIAPAVLQMLLLVVTGWFERREREALAYLMEENRLLRRQLGGLRLRLTDDDRQRLAVRAFRVGRRALREIATVVTPDKMLRWHRQLVARKWTYATLRSSRRRVAAEIRRLVVRMANENATWGYTRIQGALEKVGHRVGRSTIARILKAHAMPPVPERRLRGKHFGERTFDGRVDVSRFGDLLHRIRDRLGLASCADRRLDAPSP